jgi:putative ABC transport system ATP-binding protein
MGVISVRDVTRVYALGEVAVRALRGVSLEIDKGEFVAITGPSGSGKSTMMHILGCLDTPSSGSYLLDGVEVATLNDRQLAKTRSLKIGFVFQQFNLLPRTTALDNVELPLLYNGGGERQQRAAEALRRVGLGDRLYHLPNQLSGGQQQRVAIARALVNNPSLLLADEPTGALATLQSEEIMALFQELNDAGITVVMVTHEPDIARHAKRIVRFRDGRIVGDAPVVERLRATDLLEELLKDPMLMADNGGGMQ